MIDPELEYNTSYEFGFDNVSGWGERYFYTYYSQFGNRPVSAIIEASVLMLMFIFSLVANILIAYAVCRFREMRNVTNYFLLNLAAADLVFACSIPAIAYTRITQNWALGDIACRIVPYSQFVCCFVLLWTLTLISMDRHRCIVVPPYRSQLTPKRTTILVAIVWFLAIVIFLPVVFWFRQQVVHDQHVICTMVFPNSENIPYSLCFTLPVILIACILPMALLVYYYQRIFRKILSSRNRWAVPCVLVATSAENGSCTNTPMRRESEISMLGSLISPLTRKFSTSSQQISKPTNGRQGSLSHHEEIRLNKHIRVVRILLLNVVVVLLMWLPITVVSFLIYQDGIRPTDNTNFFLRSHHFIWCLAIAFLNTVVNPLLYGVLSENFRACFIKWWFGPAQKNSSDGKFGRSNAACEEIKVNKTPSSGRAPINGYKGKLTYNNSIQKKNSSVGSIVEMPSEEII